MFKYLCMGFLASYSYTNLIKTYEMFHKDTVFYDMKEFMYHQQDREDALREQCQLQMYILPKPNSWMENLISNYNQFVSHYSISSPMEVTSYDQFINASYDSTNVGKDIHYDNRIYTLLINGIKPTGVYSYSNQQYEVQPRKPKWSLLIDNLQLVISDISLYS